MTTADQFLERLERDLVAGIRQRAQRNKTRRRLALTATVLTVAAVLVLSGISLVPGGSAGRALAITARADSVTVRVIDASADPEGMTGELRAAGIDGEVKAIPVSGSYINQWVAIYGGPAAGQSEPFDLEDQLARHPGFLTIPRDVKGIVLFAGRPAKAGEVQTNVLPDSGTLPERPR